MLFNFQGTRPVRCSQRRIFILAHLFGFVKGFFFLLPKALPSSNPLPRPFFRSFGWVAASLFLSEAARLVYHIRRPLSRPFFLPADFFFGRAAGFCCQGARLFGNSFVIISSFFCKVKAFFQILGLFFFKKMCYNMIVVRKGSQMVYACSSVDRAPASGAGCVGSIPIRRTSPGFSAVFPGNPAFLSFSPRGAGHLGCARLLLFSFFYNNRWQAVSSYLKTRQGWEETDWPAGPSGDGREDFPRRPPRSPGSRRPAPPAPHKGRRPPP